MTVGSSVANRLIQTSGDLVMDSVDQIVFQHTVLCQTCMPYRDPGKKVRQWEQRNGQVRLRIEAGTAFDACADTFVEVPLPSGPKARLILLHLNAEALRAGSASVEVEDSLTAFARDILGYPPNGGQDSTPNYRGSALVGDVIESHRCVRDIPATPIRSQLSSKLVASGSITKTPLAGGSTCHFKTRLRRSDPAVKVPNGIHAPTRFPSFDFS